jgi:hypothetical protein
LRARHLRPRRHPGLRLVGAAIQELQEQVLVPVHNDGVPDFVTELGLPACGTVSRREASAGGLRARHLRPRRHPGLRAGSQVLVPVHNDGVPDFVTELGFNGSWEALAVQGVIHPGLRAGSLHRQPGHRAEHDHALDGQGFPAAVEAPIASPPGAALCF